jgi:hypothetical protein
VGEAVGCLVAVVVVVIVSGSLGLRSSIVAFGCVAYDQLDQWFEVDSGKQEIKRPRRLNVTAQVF